MRVQDVMTEGVQTMAPDDPAEGAWELMRRHGFHHIVVTSGSGAVVGILSDRDAGGTRGGVLRRGRTVEELMTRHVVTVDPSTTVKRAANLMRGRSIGCVVVTNRRRVVGIVTVADLLELLGRGSNRPMAATKRWTLKHRTPHQKRVGATGVW
jgi:CBS domain-containing protein